MKTKKAVSHIRRAFNVLLVMSMLIGLLPPSVAAAPTPKGTLTLSMTAPSEALPGDAITYTLRVTNTGSQAATDLTVTDALPRQVRLGKTPEGAAYQPGTHELVWKPEAIAPGATAELTVEGQVRLGARAGQVVNRATLRTSAGTEDATATTSIAAAHVDTVRVTPRQGGTLRRGPLSLDVPPGAVSKTIEVRLTLYWTRAYGRAQAGGGQPLLLRFDLDVVGHETFTFDQPVALTLNLDALVDPASLRSSLRPYLVYQSGSGEEDEAWHPVPLQRPDAERAVYTAQLDHFSGFLSGMNDDLYAGWQLQYNAPQVALFSGAGTYSYPIAVPPGRGVQPAVNLSYNNKRVDGILAWVDSGLLGVGWSMDQVDIIREGVEYCWDGNYDWICFTNDFTLILNGTGYELHPASAGQDYGRYYAKDAPGLYVERFNPRGGDSSAANTTKEYWIVRTPDGTRYRLGFTNNSEQVLYRTCEHHGNPGQGEPTCSYAGAANYYAAYRWRVDEVRDAHDNTMEVSYTETKGTCGYAYYRNTASVLKEIRYNHSSQGWGSKVEFVHSGFGYQPGCFQPAIFGNPGRLLGIKVWHLGQVVWSYELAYEYFQTHTAAEIRALSAVERHEGDYQSGQSQSLPATTFEYTLKPNKEWCDPGFHGPDCDTDWEKEAFSYPRLSAVENGYGGRSELSYQDDGRGGPWWEGFYNYRVVQTETYDGLTANPTKAAYAYDTPCYNQYGDNLPPGAKKCPGRAAKATGPLVGHDQVTATQYDFNGTTPLATQVHQYYIPGVTGYQYALLGREYLTLLRDGGGNDMRRTDNAYQVANLGPTTVTHLDETTTADVVGGQLFGRTAEFDYDGYGNTTVVREYNHNDELYRRSVSEYVYNNDADVWIVDRVSRQRVYERNEVEEESRTDYYYDNRDTHGATPTVGELVKVKACGLSQTADSITQFWYDDYGNPTTIRDPKGYETDTDYDSTYGLYPTQVCNDLGHCATTAYYGLDGVPADNGLPGQVKEVTDPNDADTELHYDAFGRLWKVFRPYTAGGYATVVHAYQDTEQPLRIVTLRREVSGTTQALRTETFYDGLGRTVQVHAEGQSDPILASQRYDALGRVAQASLPYYGTALGVYQPVSDWGALPTTDYSYDALGRDKVITAPDGSQTNHYYGLDIGTTNVGVSDPTGLWVHSTRDANSHAKHYVHDAFGRLVIVRDFTGTCYPEAQGCSDPWTLYGETQYDYDVRDNLTHVEGEDEAHTWMEYDPLGRKTDMHDPDMGDWFYEYDVAGNLEAQTDARGCVTTFAYDQLHRLTGKTYTGPGACATTPAVTYYYDQPGHGSGVGRRTSMSVPGVDSTSWTYDARGRVTEVSKTIAGEGPFVTAYTYDAMDRVVDMTYPDGEVVHHDYNTQGLPQGLTGDLTYVESADYDASSRVELLALGNTLRADYEYYPWTTPNGLGRLHRLKTGTAGDPTSLQDLSYTYDALGNVTTLTDGSNDDQVQTFEYDALDRLTHAAATGGGQGTYDHTYTYDEVGNLTGKTDLGTITYLDPAHKHAATHVDGDQKYWYDAVGNQWQRVVGTDTYNHTFDAENRLVEVTKNSQVVAAFAYDGDGVRVSKQDAGGMVTLYVGEYYEQRLGQGELNLPDPGFEEGAGWSEKTHGHFPGMSHYRGTWGTADQHSGSYAYALSDHADGWLESDPIPVSPETEYDLYVWLRGELDADDSHGKWLVRARFYNAGGGFISYQNAASGGPGTLDTAWRQEGGRVTAPAGAATARIQLWNYMNTGWVAYDDVSFKAVGSGTELAPDPGFESGTGWSENSLAAFPATSFYRGKSGTADQHSGSYAYALSNHAYGWLQSDPIPVSPGVEYDVYAWLRGEIDPDGSHGAWIIRARFYDAGGGSLGYQNAASGVAGTLDTTWRQEGGRVTAPSGAATARIQLWNHSNTGWVAYDDVSFKAVGSGTELAPDPGFENGTGWSEKSRADHPGTSLYRGTWGTAASHSGSYAYSLSNHANGWLESEPLPVSPGAGYDVYAWLRGELDADDSHGQWIVRAAFYRADGSFLSYQDAAWDWAGALDTAWQQQGGQVTAPAEAATMRVQLWNYMNSGWVAYDDVSVAGATPSTKYYYFGGQRIAMRQGGVVYYLHGDHLGSTSVASNGAGVAHARRWYHPYGSQRAAAGDLPTDLRFTGQREDAGFGLYDYHARFYDPALGRFISADTIVPDPANPQDFNRYAYVRNNPLKYVDPSGHCIPGVNCPGDPVYWRGMSEGQLAAYEQYQGNYNSYAAYSAAAAINLLTGSTLSGKAVSDLANKGNSFWAIRPDIPNTRTFRNQYITPRQQAKLINRINDLAADSGAPIPRFSAEATKGSIRDLRQLLAEPDKAVIVTVRWEVDHPTSGHAIVLGAYNPTNTENGVVKPWGFLNWWDDPASGRPNTTLTWMTDKELRNKWGGNVTLMGNYNMVVISIDAPEFSIYDLRPQSFRGDGGLQIE